MIVRRFTDELEGTSTLEAGTREAQHRIDIRENEIAKAQTESIYRQLTSSQELVQEGQEIHNALQKACTRFFESIQKDSKEKKLWIFGTNRQTSKQKLKARIEHSNPRTLDEVKTLVENIAKDWTEGHSKVYTNFNKICNTLDRQKTLFSLIPTENIYMTTLSGALSMVVQASVCHEEIAENLSDAVAKICERITTCVELADVIRTQGMEGKLTLIYDEFFSFLLSTAFWFTKSRVRRFFDSFNKSILEGQRKTIGRIETAIDHMLERGHVEAIGKVSSQGNNTTRRLSDIEKTLGLLVDQNRSRNYPDLDFQSLGSSMLRLLTAMSANFNSKAILDQARYLEFLQDSALIAEDGSLVKSMISQVSEPALTRAEMDDRCQRLEQYIFGIDGLALAQDGRPLLAAPDVVYRLGSWMSDGAMRSLKLWLEFLFEIGEDTSARMTAVRVTFIAATANAPFISYICEVPNSTEISQTSSTAKLGLLSMIYSLIRQLLRFRPTSDAFSIKTATLDMLDGGVENWNVALETLESLLQHTPVLRYCIIHGLNDLEIDNGDQSCKEFLKVLCSHCAKSSSPFSLLFTTSGQSRVLYDVIDFEDHVESTEKRLTVERHGQELEVQI